MSEPLRYGFQFEVAGVVFTRPDAAHAYADGLAHFAETHPDELPIDLTVRSSYVRPPGGSGSSSITFVKPAGFYEDDEPAERIFDVFDRGEKHLTVPPQDPPETPKAPHPNRSA